MPVKLLPPRRGAGSVPDNGEPQAPPKLRRLGNELRYMAAFALLLLLASAAWGADLGADLGTWWAESALVASWR